MMCLDTPDQQALLFKELLTNNSKFVASSADGAQMMPSLQEEMPHLQNVKMVEYAPLAPPPSPIVASSQDHLVLAIKEIPPHSPILRRESDESNNSKLSGSTADLTSIGESSVSSMISNSRLYGREQEEAILRATFDRVVRQKAPRQPNFVLISGAGGTGKTRLGESLRCHVKKAGGYFCSGKFDQHQDDHFAPLCAAFNSYVVQILQEDEETVRATRLRIRTAVENDLCSLSKMIPPLGVLMCDDLRRADSIQEECVKCNEKKGKSMFALHKLMRSICSPERPMVMMLDDIQWAARCPLHKWRAMINDDMNEGIMFLGICRDDVPSDSEVSNFLRGLEEQDHVEITNVTIGNLGKESIDDMINEVLVMPPDQSKALVDFVFDHSAGNAYFAVETLRIIQNDSGLIKYNPETQSWIVDRNVCGTVKGFCPRACIVETLRAKPRDIQKVLMAASCLGSNITQRLLEVALQENIDERFHDLITKKQLVYNSGRGTYSFLQNAFQSACYNLIGDDLQPAFHLEIGLRLWRHLDEEELDDNLFLVLNQLKQGVDLIRDQKVRYDIAAVCIKAAEKAALHYSIPTASSYLRFAFVLLGPNHWKEAYDLSLVLHNYSAEVEFAQGDSDLVDNLIDEILSNAKECQDKIRAYTTRIYVLGARGNTENAIEIGIRCLKMLGVNITPQCHKLSLAWSSARIARKLRGKSDPMIKRLPQMQDWKKLASMQILNMLFLNTYLDRKDLFPFVVLKMMKLTLMDGLSTISTVAFAGYGALLCHSGKIEEGLRFGKLALELVDEWNAQSFQSRVGAFVWGSIFVHVRPFIESLEQLKGGYRLGLQTGDVEFAMQNATLHTMFLVDTGKFPMSVMIHQLNEFKDLAALHGHPTQLDVLNPMLYAMKVFSDPNGNLTEFACTHDGHLAWQECKNTCAKEIVYSAKIFFYFVSGKYESAVEMIDGRIANNASQPVGSIHEAFDLYVDGLALFAQARHTRSAADAKKQLKRARHCMQLLKALSRNNPSVSLGKYVLLEAENAAVMKNNVLAEEKYNHAASLASRHGSNFELAFAKQAAGEHFAFDLGDNDRAISCFEEACKAYELWEGKAAVSHLKRRIDFLQKSTN